MGEGRDKGILRVRGDPLQPCYAYSYRSASMGFRSEAL